MPVTIAKKDGHYQVRTPHGVKAKHTTKANAEAQARLLNAVEHSSWRPTGHKGLLNSGK
jgi:hypothetical protein